MFYDKSSNSKFPFYLNLNRLVIKIVDEILSSTVTHYFFKFILFICFINSSDIMRFIDSRDIVKFDLKPHK